MRMQSRFGLVGVVLSILLAAACTPADQQPPTSVATTSETFVEPENVEDIDVCALVSDEELTALLGEVPEADFDHMSLGNTACSWRSTVGAFQDAELSVQVSDGGSGFAASDEIVVLKDIMEFQEDVIGLGDGAFLAEWSADGKAVVVASGSRTVTVALDQPIDTEALQTLTQSVLDRLP